MPRGDPQINIRTSPDRYGALEAAAFLGGQTVQELVRGIVEAEADQHAKSPPVARVLRERAEYQAEQTGRLARITPADGP